VTGSRTHAISPRALPPEFREGMELEWPLVALEPFLFIANAALDRLMYDRGESLTHWKDMLVSRIDAQIVEPKITPRTRQARLVDERDIAKQIYDKFPDSREDRFREWKERVGKSERALYRRLADLGAEVLEDALGGIEFRCVGRLLDQRQADGTDLLVAVGRGPIPDQRRERRLPLERVDGGQQPLGPHGLVPRPPDAAAAAIHRQHQIAPLVARLDRRNRALARQHPHPLQDRLQTDAVLVGSPHLHLRLREGSGDRAAQRADFFVNASCSSALAAT